MWTAPSCPGTRPQRRPVHWYRRAGPRRIPARSWHLGLRVCVPPIAWVIRPCSWGWRFPASSPARRGIEIVVRNRLMICQNVNVAVVLCLLGGGGHDLRCSSIWDFICDLTRGQQDNQRVAKEEYIRHRHLCFSQPQWRCWASRNLHRRLFSLSAIWCPASLGRWDVSLPLIFANYFFWIIRKGDSYSRVKFWTRSRGCFNFGKRGKRVVKVLWNGELYEEGPRGLLFYHKILEWRASRNFLLDASCSFLKLRRHGLRTTKALMYQRIALYVTVISKKMLPWYEYSSYCLWAANRTIHPHVTWLSGMFEPSKQASKYIMEGLFLNGDFYESRRQ